MTEREVGTLVNKIKIHRQYFANTIANGLNDVVKEWYRILKDYSFTDVDEQLDKFFLNDDNTGKIPDAYYLSKYLVKEEDKKKTGKKYCRCMFCGKELEYELELTPHEDRCRSIQYLKRICRKYFNKELENTEAMYEMQNRDFKIKYYKVLEKILPYAKEFNFCEYKWLKNVIDSHYGKEVEYSINDGM